MDEWKHGNKNWIDFWRHWLNLSDWHIISQSILKEQVCYDDSIPDSDRYFIGIEIKKKYKVGVIYHDRELDGTSILHELLHIKFPNFSEDEVNKRCDEIVIGSRYGTCPGKCKHLYS